MRKTCIEMVYELAKRDERVVFLGSDLGAGLLEDMKRHMPDRWFMEGVSEQNIIGMSAGLAAEGFIPYVNTIAPFLTRRCFEQVALDLCLHKLPVRLIGNGGGMVYAPLGPTHMAIEDIAIMRALPEMTVVAVADADEMRRMMKQTLDWPGPIYIRLAKGGDPIVSSKNEDFKLGKSVVMREPGDVLIITTGIMASQALEAAELLAQESINCGVMNVHTVKPFDATAVIEMAKKVQLIVTAEEHVLAGGLGSVVLECLADHLDGPIPPVKRMGIPDTFPNISNKESWLP